MEMNPLLIDRLVLALAHFVWQGCLLVVLAWLVEALGIRSVHKRYGLSLCLLAACVVLPCLTFAIVEPDQRPELIGQMAVADSVVPHVDPQTFPAVADSDEEMLPVIIPGPSADADTFPVNVTEYEGTIAQDRLLSSTIPTFATPTPELTWLQQNGYWFAIAWACGVSALVMRLLFATTSATVLRWRGRPVDADWQREIERLARLMELRRPPNAILSRMVRQVCVVGLYQPVILFPAAWASGVPSDVLEAVIAHELAHIRRHDVWVIHLQRVVETLLFFHPAVWWISRQVSRHRELCCDADAAVALNSPVKYARALEYVALREYSRSQTLFMATLGGKKMELLERIQTVLGAEPARPRRWQGSLAACLVLAVILTAAVWLTLPALATSNADDDAVTAEPLAAEIAEPEDTASQSVSEPEPIAGSANIVLTAEPDVVTSDSAYTERVIERLRAAGITFEPVYDGSSRYRIGGYVGLEFASEAEYSRITRDVHHLLDAGRLEDVIVSVEPEASLADFKMGQWHQRRLQAELGYLPDELDVIGFLPHPHLRRFVVHDGAFEFITPETQCTPEELAAIGAECTTLPIESSFYYDKQVDGIWWRVHGFRDKPWLIVVEDVSSPVATVVASGDAGSEEEPTPLSEEELAAMERLSAAGCLIEIAEGIPTAIELPDEFDSPVMEDLVRLRERVRTVALRGQSISEDDLLVRIMPALQTLEISDARFEFRRSDRESVAIRADRILIEVNHDLEGNIARISAEDGSLRIKSDADDVLAFEFSLMLYDVATESLQLEGGVRGTGLNGTALSAESISIDLSTLAIGNDEADEGAAAGEQVLISYPVARFLTLVPVTDGEATQESIDALTRLIRTQVPAESWVDGEVPRIIYYPATMSFIISQDRETHARIKVFLDDLGLLLRDGREMTETVESEEQDQTDTLNLPTISPRDEQPSDRNFLEQFRNQFLQPPEQLPEIDMEEFLERFEGEYRPHNYREFLLSHGVDESQLKPLPQPATQGELALANALNEITSINADNVRLSNVLQSIADRHEINIFVDVPALRVIGVSSDTPVSFVVEGITLRSALKLVLDPLDAGFLIENNVLTITSRQTLEGGLTIRTYAVADLLQPGGEDVTPEEETLRLERIVSAVRQLAVPNDWSEVGGSGSIQSHRSTLSLIVRQTSAGHREVAQVLESLRGREERSMLSLRPGESFQYQSASRFAKVEGFAGNIAEVEPVSPNELRITGMSLGRTRVVVTDEFDETQQIEVVVTQDGSAAGGILSANGQIEQALLRRIDVSLRRVPLSDAIHTISEQLGINIVLDEPGLNEVGLTSEETVDLSLRSIPTRQVLDLLLDPLLLGYVIQDEVLFVTNLQRLEGRMDVVAYDVSDLVDFSNSDEWNELAEILRTTVAPESWEDRGGQGSIAFIPWRSRLLVRQSAARHEAVRAVLSSLRQARGQSQTRGAPLTPLDGSDPPPFPR